jgi:hypothetical protein
LKDKGYVFTNGMGGRILICINHDIQSYKKFMNKGNSRAATILIRTEPFSVFPAQYSNFVSNLYGFVISSGYTASTTKPESFFPCLYSFQEKHGGPNFNDPKPSQVLSNSIKLKKYTQAEWATRSIEILILASNKYSPVRNSGYDLRRSIVRLVKNNERFHIYGQYWNLPFLLKIKLYLSMYRFNLKTGYVPHFNIRQFFNIKSSNIFGNAQNKSKVLLKSKFILIIENSRDFLTEKIFDAFLTGIIPIYCGPELSKYGVPEQTYIHLNWDLSNFKQVIERLEVIDVQSYLSSILKFLSSEDFKIFWDEDTIYNLLTTKIHKYIRFNFN